MSLDVTAAGGDRRESLVELRGILARAIDSCESGRDLAALTMRFQAVLAELDELGDPKKAVSAVDEIAERRRARSA